MICHMTTTLDGKVTGEHLRRTNHVPVSEVYYEINRNYKADGFACGRITMEESFTGSWYPDLSQYPEVRHGIGLKMDFMLEMRIIPILCL
jgi:hypothetical protein